MKTNYDCEREYDFALILRGAHELTASIEDRLFEAGCDDATLSLQYGNIYMEFSRVAPSLKDAILSAIKNVRKADAGVDVRRVDECNLVTASEIARRIKRSRQLIHQYITGKRGPAGFPAPECNVTEGTPLWAWCSVSYWLVQNNMIRPEELQEAEVVDAVNTALELRHQRARNRQLFDEVENAIR